MNNLYSELDKKSLLKIANQFHTELLLSGFSGSDIENILLKEKPDFLSTLSAITAFEVSDSTLRESINDAIYLKLSNSIFGIDTINNYQDFSSDLQFKNSVLNIAGSDLPLKIISLSIQEYSHFTDIQMTTIAPFINDINSKYIEFHSLSPDYNGFSDHHSNKLGISISSPAPLKNHRNKLYELICDDPSMLEELDKSFNDLEAINRVHEELLEYHLTSKESLQSLSLSLITHIENNIDNKATNTLSEIGDRIKQLFT